MKHALYFLLLYISSFSASAQQTEAKPTDLVDIVLFSVVDTDEPPIEWLSLPKTVKIFANGKLLTAYKDYGFGIDVFFMELRFLNADLKIILPNNKTVFKATAKRKTHHTLEPITGFFERTKYLNDKGEEIEKVTINKPLSISTNGEGVSISTTLDKNEKILYLVDNKVVDESSIAKIDEVFMKKVVQLNAEDSDLVAKFGERAKGFDTVFCIWTSNLMNKK
ncbi:hypothetical protein GCM10011514_51740 [Emticicia aquatilis]|uniref:Uncharacterized protein n=1 Tax=Emticicia aquatilis TaxID=1537369 RepID=A0A917DZC6_9BACT|nr:hypothetical protein [Emticicia aquatilis]GGD81306.1 hypothetical protein GCM10011514_51740 [Emticicia aquatilis]